MRTEITLSEYRKLSEGLPFKQPLEGCCEKGFLDTVYVEPLKGRNTLEVERTCIVKCPVCGRQYLSRWD
jgi:hypothetical protein